MGKDFLDEPEYVHISTQVLLDVGGNLQKNFYSELSASSSPPPSPNINF